MIQFSVGPILFHLAENDSAWKSQDLVVIQSANDEIVYQKAKEILGKLPLYTQDFLFLFDDLEKNWQAILKKFQLVHSAGGIVEAEGKYLFIKRKNKWDLPKGKIEEGESSSEAAEREIFEETGVKAKCLFHIIDTWHCYNDFGPMTLKCTHWFAMSAGHIQDTRPQKEEGIHSALWLGKQEVEQILPYGFHTVRQTFEAYELRKL